MPGIDFFLVAGLCAVLGAIVQSGIGLGLGLVAAPIVTLAFPETMPGALLIAATVLALFVLVKEVKHADWHGLGWAFAGRLAGTPLGVWFVAAIPAKALGPAVGTMVLVAIGASLWRSAIPRNPGTLFTAGLFAGGLGTATSIGGPPMALLYQREDGPMVRATLSLFFTVGAFLSVVTLKIVGQLPTRQIWAGLSLTPFVILGFAISGPFRRLLDRGGTRQAILAITGFSALTLIVRSLLQ
jgi:uncharacterized membrane protein YfcA